MNILNRLKYNRSNLKNNVPINKDGTPILTKPHEAMIKLNNNDNTNNIIKDINGNKTIGSNEAYFKGERHPDAVLSQKIMNKIPLDHIKDVYDGVERRSKVRANTNRIYNQLRDTKIAPTEINKESNKYAPSEIHRGKYPLPIPGFGMDKHPGMQSHHYNAYSK